MGKHGHGDCALAVGRAQSSHATRRNNLELDPKAYLVGRNNENQASCGLTEQWSTAAANISF